MEKILSQDEINALFSSMSSDTGTLDSSADKAAVVERTVSKYDFCRSDRIGKEQFRALHQMHTHFARAYTISLSAYMRTPVEVSLISIDKISYSEFLKLLSDPTLICALSIAPYHGNLGLELNPPLLFPIIDLLLGGSGKASTEKRALTDLEIQIIEGVIKLALRDLKDSWRSVLDADMQLVGMETKPQMLQLVSPGEPVVALGFEVKMGEVSGVLNLCIPGVILKMNRDAFEVHRQTRGSGSETSETAKISDILRGARVAVTSEIRDQVLLVEDVLNINVGDVIQINHALGDPVQLNIGGIAKFAGRIIARNGRRKMEISHKITS